MVCVFKPSNFYSLPNNTPIILINFLITIWNVWIHSLKSKQYKYLVNLWLFIDVCYFNFWFLFLYSRKSKNKISYRIRTFYKNLYFYFRFLHLITSKKYSNGLSIKESDSTCSLLLNN